MSKPAFNPLEFLTTPWGQLPIGAAIPGGNPFNPADLKELDKRIAELKAVEQWLNLNLSLLRTTIQTLEVQRGTIAAIQSFGESMARASGAPSEKPTASSSRHQGADAPKGSIDPSAFVAAPSPGSDQAAFWWESMQQQFGQMMKAAQASAQSMVESKPKSVRKSGSKTPPGDNGSAGSG
jgi:hypothetical protein